MYIVFQRLYECFETHNLSIDYIVYFYHFQYNQASIRQLQIASSNGLTTARSMAKVHSLVVQRKLITNDRLLQMLMQPKLVDEIDIINGYAESKGYGFQYTKNILVSCVMD